MKIMSKSIMQGTRTEPTQARDMIREKELGQGHKCSQMCIAEEVLGYHSHIEQCTRACNSDKWVLANKT